MECLPLFNVPTKLIRLIELTQINGTERFKVNNEYRQEFKVDSGLKQGDPLSTNLFIVFVDVILKQLDLRRNKPTRWKQCSAYADDILIITRTKE